MNRLELGSVVLDRSQRMDRDLQGPQTAEWL